MKKYDCKVGNTNQCCYPAPPPWSMKLNTWAADIRVSKNLVRRTDTFACSVRTNWEWQVKCTMSNQLLLVTHRTLYKQRACCPSRSPRVAVTHRMLKNQTRCGNDSYVEVTNPMYEPSGPRRPREPTSSTQTPPPPFLVPILFVLNALRVRFVWGWVRNTRP